jgi:hypothetical protein
MGEVEMRWALVVSCAVIGGGLHYAGAQAAVHIDPADARNTPNLRDQTASAAIQNYVQAWQTLKIAFQQNRSDLLDKDFIGTAEDKLSETIQQQRALGIRTHYQDRAHDIRIVFYSPEGLSLELRDSVDYDVQVFDHDQVGPPQHLRATYIVVMSPTETRWRVRVFQAEQE